MTPASPTNTQLLGIYLNDHLAGAVGGGDLAKRLADAEATWVGGDVLAAIAAEVEEDRSALMSIMAALGVSVRRYKTVAAWMAEKVARLKPNGRVFARSPLSRVIELEVLRLGVEGKAAAWRTLRGLADIDQRLDAAQLDDLIDRANRQVDHLEQLRVRAAAEAFGGGAASVESVVEQDGEDGVP
jgi:hypothetical protein